MHQIRLLLHLISLNLIFACVAYAVQIPFWSTPSAPTAHQELSAIGIIDVGAGPKYRDYKRYLPIYPSSSLHATLHHGSSLHIRALPKRTTQHVNLTREAISHALVQSRMSTPEIAWTTKEILVPDVTDLVTVTALAQIANNAYIEIPRTYDWIDVNGPWNLSSDFGWEKNGLRGHVFATPNNETIIISLKGTSPAVFIGGTGGNDKINVPPSLPLSVLI
jgi:putative lipase involved disintegration of autophagic bodies